MSNLQAKLDRQRAFWRRENHDRPVIGFTGTYFSTDTIRMLKRTGGRPVEQQGRNNDQESCACKA